MTHSTAVWPPHTSLFGAPGSRNCAPFPPVCPPPGNWDRTPASPPPRRPGIPLDVRSLTPLPILLEHSYPANHRTNLLPKRRSLS
jgi:hypothetical protein